MKGKTSPDQCNNEKSSRITYSIEYLARLSMSPLCLVYPNDWERISNEYPMLVKKVRVQNRLVCNVYCFCFSFFAFRLLSTLTLSNISLTVLLRNQRLYSVLMS